MISIDLSGKVAVVTGGSGQLGRVMVRTLLRAGAHVAVHYFKDQATAKLLVNEAKAMGHRAFAVQSRCDQRGIRQCDAGSGFPRTWNSRHHRE